MSLSSSTPRIETCAYAMGVESISISGLNPETSNSVDALIQEAESTGCKTDFSSESIVKDFMAWAKASLVEESGLLPSGNKKLKTDFVSFLNRLTMEW